MMNGLESSLDGKRAIRRGGAHCQRSGGRSPKDFERVGSDSERRRRQSRSRKMEESRDRIHYFRGFSLHDTRKYPARFLDF